jgi:hypothetical protein
VFLGCGGFISPSQTPLILYVGAHVGISKACSADPHGAHVDVNYKSIVLFLPSMMHAHICVLERFLPQPLCSMSPGD